MKAFLFVWKGTFLWKRGFIHFWKDEKVSYVYKRKPFLQLTRWLFSFWKSHDSVKRLILKKMGISKVYFKGKGYEFLEKGFWCERVPPLILCCALYVSLLLLVFKKKKILSAIAGFSKNKLKFSFYTLESYFMCFNNLLILFDNSHQHFISYFSHHT